MKFIKIIFAITPAIILSSCGTTSPSAGGGFWGGISNYVDYGISQWEKHIPADSYDHTRIDAWKSGTGGKSLVLGEIAVGVAGAITNKDVKALQERIHNATKKLNDSEAFNKNDVNNWVGALFTVGDEFIDEYNKQKFEEAVERLTNPEVPGYNDEEALRVNYIDYENRKIIWKSNSEYINDLINYRKTKNDSWVSENLETIGMSLSEYDNLPKEQRQEIDLKMLAIDKPKQNSEEAPEKSVTPPAEPAKPDYRPQIEGIVISDYAINASRLTDENKAVLNKIADILKADNSLYLQIIGHTCSLGTEKINYEIGLKRAVEAKNYLVDLGINADRIYTESEGFNNPVANNSTIEGRKHNRRITFKLK